MVHQANTVGGPVHMQKQLFSQFAFQRLFGWLGDTNTPTSALKGTTTTPSNHTTSAIIPTLPKPHKQASD
jgi:hypothetical protein